MDKNPLEICLETFVQQQILSLEDLAWFGAQCHAQEGDNWRECFICSLRLMSLSHPETADATQAAMEFLKVPTKTIDEVENELDWLWRTLHDYPEVEDSPEWYGHL